MNIKKIIAGLAAVCVISFSGTALAAGPAEETETDEQTDYTIAVSVDDITEVMEKLEDYEDEIDMLAQLVYAEARGIQSKAEQAAVIWCVLNRVDAKRWGDTISGVIRARSQFAYSSKLPVKEGFKSLAQDVVVRWLLEKQGVEEVGRVLPADYCYFSGHSGHNWFRKSYYCGKYWNWLLQDPYQAPSAEEEPAA